MELLRVTSYIDFPERKYLIFSYLFRFIMVSIWCIDGYLTDIQSGGLERTRFNHHWLLAYVLETCIFLVLEIRSFVDDVSKRASMEAARSTFVVVRTLQGRNLGPFPLSFEQERRDPEWMQGIVVL